MLAIKLQRIGKKHQPSYRLVVAEKKSKMAAPPVEDLGSYSTTTKQAHLKAERVKHWLGIGAQPTLTVHNLLVREKLLTTPKIQMKFPPVADRPSADKAPEKAPAVEAKPAAASAPVDKPAATPAVSAESTPTTEE